MRVLRRQDPKVCRNRYLFEEIYLPKDGERFDLARGGSCS
ncbi:hypothetical protein V6Z11_D11G051400 [Gossypium hirsutum]